MPLTEWCLRQARDALGLIDKLSSNAQPVADMLCTRGQCCSALGNNALVRCALDAVTVALQHCICPPPIHLVWHLL